MASSQPEKTPPTADTAETTTPPTTTADAPSTAGGPTTTTAPSASVPESTLTHAQLFEDVDQTTHDQIEAEEQADHDDTDSALGDDNHSYTTSLKSSVTNYIEENGRRYHAVQPRSYFLPNDEAELDRLDLFHHCLVIRAEGKLHLAPIDPHPQRILDLGTGTGIWAIEMGDKYPSAEILGNDISPVQPQLVPPNVTFEVDDMEADWVYSSKFDFVHARYLAGSIRDWPRLVRQAYEFTKPGGWVEFADFDMKFYTTNGEFRPGCNADRWGKEVAAGIEGFGLEPHPGGKLHGWVKDAGFINVVNVPLPVPLGPLPKDKRLKEVGSFDLLSFLDGLEAISLRVFTQVRGWTKEEVRVFLALVRKDMLNPRMQMQHDYHVCYGQKPYESGEA